MSEMCTFENPSTKKQPTSEKRVDFMLEKKAFFRVYFQPFLVNMTLLYRMIFPFIRS